MGSRSHAHWILGFFPVWVLGVVDYNGSQLVELEPLAWPSSAAVIGATERAFTRHGEPQRMLMDRGSVFRSDAFQAFLSSRGVRHTLTRPCHPWTNERIERVFRTFKQTIGHCFWLLRNRAHIERVCADFVQFYNTHRPRQSYDGRTPDEVHTNRVATIASKERIALFDGRLLWWRFS